MKKRILLLLVVMLALGAGRAQTAEMPGMGMGMGMDGAHMSPAGQEYLEAMKTMHDSMMKGVTDSDPDAAFVRGMLPHHEGAVEMARIELKYGKDPELRELAKNIIDAQDKEIQFMKAWLQKSDAME